MPKNRKFDLKIFFFNTYLHGGAAIGAKSAFEHLPHSIDAHFFYMDSKIPIHSSKYLKINPYVQSETIFDKLNKSLKARVYYSKLKKILKNKPVQYEQFSPAKQFYKTPFSLFSNKLPDIIHLHWIAEWIDYESFFQSIPDQHPIVWTLHDMNPFTGGCHYAWECNKYQTECKKCPQLNQNQENNYTINNFNLKYNSLKGKNLHIVADSTWLENEAKKSTILKNAKSFQTIHYGIDLTIFKPQNKTESRKSLNILSEKKIILFGANDLKNKRKGFKILIDSLKILFAKRKDFICMVYGEINISDSFQNTKLPEFKMLGKINDKNKLAQIYTSADIFVIPSLYEAFGLTAIEAMACGTAVIGFNSGGISDSIIHNETGILINNKDTNSLVEGIELLLNNDVLRMKLSESAMKFVKYNFSFKNQTNKYLNLYSSIIN